MNEFKYALDQEVVITASGEEGKIICRADYTTRESSYLVRYQQKNGVATESWWTETALVERTG